MPRFATCPIPAAAAKQQDDVCLQSKSRRPWFGSELLPPRDQGRKAGSCSSWLHVGCGNRHVGVTPRAVVGRLAKRVASTARWEDHVPYDYRPDRREDEVQDRITHWWTRLEIEEMSWDEATSAPMQCPGYAIQCLLFPHQSR